MKSKKLFSFIFRTIFLFIVWGDISALYPQQFPIGTYWVRDPNSRERCDQYGQVASCGINIVVGGTNYYSSPLREILDSAEVNGIKLVVNNAAANSYIYWYSNGYRMQYESDGYHSNPSYPRLVTIEDTILYDFDHQVGEVTADQHAQDGWAVRAQAPGKPGYLIHNYSGSDWREPGYSYYATFRLKIRGDVTQHTPVARLLVVLNGTDNRVDQEIYADDFVTSGQYQDFEYFFQSSTTSSSSQGTVEESYKDWLPEGNQAQLLQADIDYRVYWHGQVTLYVDYVAIENSAGDSLFDGVVDNNIRNEASNAHTNDPDHDTILGFYNDEPNIAEIRPISYINNLVGPESPPSLPYPAVVSATRTMFRTST